MSLMGIVLQTNHSQIFDFMPAGPAYAKVASDVISHAIVSQIVLDNAVKFDDLGLNLSQNIRLPKSSVTAFSAVFSAITS